MSERKESTPAMEAIHLAIRLSEIGVIKDANEIRRAKAEAWDEGWSSGWDDCHAFDSTGNFNHGDESFTNPYRGATA